METIISDKVVKAKNGKVVFVYPEEKVYDGVVVAEGSAETIVRIPSGKLYVLHVLERVSPHVGQKVVISVQKDMSSLPSLYSKPMKRKKYVVSEKESAKARIICRLNDKLLLCDISGRLPCPDDVFPSPTHEVFVQCTPEEQEHYAKEQKGFLLIPVADTGKILQIPPCLQKGSKRKRRG